MSPTTTKKMCACKICNAEVPFTEIFKHRREVHNLRKSSFGKRYVKPIQKKSVESPSINPSQHQLSALDKLKNLNK